MNSRRRRWLSVIGTVLMSGFVVTSLVVANDDQHKNPFGLAVVTPHSIQIGTFQLPIPAFSGQFCSDDLSASSPMVRISFKKPFPAPPLVVVTQEIKSKSISILGEGRLAEFGDTYLVIYNVTNTGFDVQRRTTYNYVCNEIGIVNYIAVGKGGSGTHPSGDQ